MSSETKPPLFDANQKYFFTSPWWRHDVRLKQASDPTVTYMDESAVRARAGILHLMGWTIMLCSFVIPQYTVIQYVGPFVIWDMFSGVVFGLTPLCPTGVLGTIIAWNVRPYYTPSVPKKFAWCLGILMAAFCVEFRLLYGPHWIIKGVIAMCILLTWLESTLGFCLGCWIFTRIRRCCCNKQSTKDPQPETPDANEHETKESGEASTSPQSPQSPETPDSTQSSVTDIAVDICDE